MSLSDVIEKVRGTGRLAGKVAAITGVGGGQGQAAAMIFAAAGATVVGTEINPKGIEATQALASSLGLTVEVEAVNAASEDETGAWLDGAAARHGGLDILYNNAGLTQFAPIGEMTLDQWRETMRYELDVVFIPTRAAWKHLVARGGGAIVNIASVSGMRGTEYMGAAAHAAGKGGVIGFTNQVALEGAPHGIRCNTVSPGPILTPVTAAALEAMPQFKHHFEGFPMLSRIGNPEDVALACLFLASDEASFITGANLVVDGGWSAKGGFTPH